MDEEGVAVLGGKKGEGEKKKGESGYDAWAPFSSSSLHRMRGEAQKVMFVPFMLLFSR